MKKFKKEVIVEAEPEEKVLLTHKREHAADDKTGTVVACAPQAVDQEEVSEPALKRQAL